MHSSRYFNAGKLNPPASMIKAKDEYMETVDPLKQFVQERLDKCEGIDLKMHDFFLAFKGWCRDTKGVEYKSDKGLATRLNALEVPMK